MTWLQRLFGRDRLERELEAELRDHFDRLVADYKAAGNSDADARRLARLEFGGDDQVKEACRDARGTRWVDESIQDARYAARGFRRNPGFTAVAVVTLALGIGASLAVFTVVDALLLRPLPVPNASELVTFSRWRGASYSESFSYPQIRELADRRDLFASLCGIGTETVHVGPPDDLQPAGVAWVSGGYFETLGISPFVGRVLSAADDERGAAPAVVLSHSFWQRRFGGNRDVVGSTLTIDGQQVPVVGITPSGFNGAVIGESADLTLAINAKAIVQPETAAEGWTTADARWLLLLARPAHGLSIDQLQSRVDVIWPAVLDGTTPASVTGDARRRALSMTVRVDPGQTGASRLRQELRSPLIAGMLFVTIVLLIACVNVANLLLARGAGRAREVSMRLALGAGRGRIIRQRLIESALLATAGTALGGCLGWLGSAGLVQLIARRAAGPDASLLALDIDPNWRLLLACVVVMAAATMLFGLLPAVRASRAPAVTITSSVRVAESQTRFATALIVAQISLSLMLVIGAGLFTRSVHNLRTIDRGFASGANVLLASYDPRRLASSSQELQQFSRAVLDTVSALPGVGEVSLAAITPLQGGGMSTPMKVNGVTTDPKEIYFNVVAPRFFEIVGTPLLLGRDLSPNDDRDAPPVTVVNEAFVRAFLTGPPLGQHVLPPGPQREFEIVGVVKDAVYETLRAPAPPTIYMSYLQQRGRPMTIVAGAKAPIADVAAVIRRAIQPRVPAAPMRIRTFASQIENSRGMFEARLMRLLTAIFGAIALLLAAIGLYGLMSYSVALRTREIGVRLALGARPSGVMRMIVGSALRMVAIGVIAGLPIAWFASRLITRLVFGVTPSDPATIAAAISILAAVGLFSAALPARRAALVDPVTSIHVE